MPLDHGWHTHTYFTTYKVRLRNANKWVNLLDKGRMTSLDNPEVRALASRYGDPDYVLAEDWIPEVPGINAPGDYMKDYAPNPGAYALKVRGQGATREPTSTTSPPSRRPRRRRLRRRRVASRLAANFQSPTTNFQAALIFQRGFLRNSRATNLHPARARVSIEDYSVSNRAVSRLARNPYFGAVTGIGPGARNTSRVSSGLVGHVVGPTGALPISVASCGSRWTVLPPTTVISTLMFGMSSWGTVM